MHTQTRDDALAQHLHDEHQQSPFAAYFREVIYGGIDGIITTFAVVAGFSGAALSADTTTQVSFLVVLLFGLANLFADGVSMGLGSFLSVRSEQDLYKASRGKEEHEIAHNSEMEYSETITILMQKGYEEADAIAMAGLYRKNPAYWLDFMMNHELEMPDPMGDNPIYTGLATFVSFLIFGIIPLLPFLFLGGASAGALFLYSIIGTFLALVTLGILKWKVVGAGLRASLFEVVVVGSAAAAVAYFVGTFFSL
ncbi:MAG: VIT1/CCC1 family predicted Fe2+/Mn2+ transporter [Acidimicrobiales bacterium]|jgi:VIT1/CCC1 family predicted Fe2+/Mn2+ transporter